MRIRLLISEPLERVDRALLRFLKREHPALSRAQLKTLFYAGRVLLGGKSISASQELLSGEHELDLHETDLAIDLKRLSNATAQPSERGCFLPVVYEDDSLLVLNKISGIPSIPHATDETNTAVGAALAHCPSLSDIGRGGLEPGILHRLDTGTSGLLVFAKTEKEYRRLSALWKARQVRKFYRALVAGDAHDLPPLMDWPMMRNPKSSKRMMVLRKPGAQSGSGGKPLPARTRIIGVHKRGSVSDVEIEIETGVMHQIRAHLAEAGFPILGDSTYRGQAASRLFLHAWKLVIPLDSEKDLDLVAPLGPDWGPS